MVSVEEATSIILSHLFKPKKEKVSLIASTGRILAEPIHADRDLPPFDRVTMDGIAICFSAFEHGNRSFDIKATLAAGQPPVTLTNPESCIEVMTGAVLPAGTDTVIRYEDLEIKNGSAHLNSNQISKSQNIHFKGIDAKANDLLLSSGMILSPAEVALMASVGKSEVEVFSFPKTAIISTGDELVPINQTPFPHQVRLSNAFSLQAALNSIHCKSELFHIKDQKEKLEKDLTTIFQDHELIILSGGVSKGKFDFVPQVLESLGIKKFFHHVSQKPGKPFWFGADGRHTVFALPGNPVSTYMCFYRFIRPWLMASMGATGGFDKAILAKDFTFKPSLTYFLQVKIDNKDGKILATPAPGGGSGDFANLKDVDGFLELPAAQSDFGSGEIFSFIPFRHSSR